MPHQNRLIGYNNIPPNYGSQFVFRPTKGVWGNYGDDLTIPAALVNNKGIVGVQINSDWQTLNPSLGVYDYTDLDNMIGQAAAAGFKVTIAPTMSHYRTPQHIIDATAPGDIVWLLDPTNAASHHDTFCTSPATCIPWRNPFRQARLDLQALLGARYKDNPAVEGYMVQGANHHSQDWNVQDLVSSTVVCPSAACPGIIPGFNCVSKIINLDGTCTITVDQVQQWLAGGWNETDFVNGLKETLDAAAIAWPKQRLELPIGGISDPLMATNYSSPAKAIMDYVFGVDDLIGPHKDYANRFYMARQIFLASWKDGDFYLNNIPGMGSPNFIRYMIAKRARDTGPFPGRANVQNQWGATSGPPQCLLQGNVNGVCGPTCPPPCVLKATFDKAKTYNLDRIEIVAGDAANTDPAMYDACIYGTNLLGGIPRP